VQVLAVNVGAVGDLETSAGRVRSAIRKRPVAGPVAVGALGLAGDAQADPTVHGGLSKAVYAFPSEHYAVWQTMRAQARAAAWDGELPPGSMGENLTLLGLVEDALWIGDRLQLPDCALVVTEPRQPCHKFNAVMGFEQAARLMRQSGTCGAYLAVAEPGSVRAGDSIRLQPGPRELRLLDLFRARARR
jgi:MOSC domain-containing protein YiiM